MYTITLDGSYLLYPSIDDLSLTNAELSLEVNKAGNLSFTIYPNNPLYGSIQKLKSIVEVYQDGVLLYRGRVLNESLNFDKSKDVLCEGDLAYLNDSVMRPYNFNGSIEDYLTMMITSHNAQVEVDKQFTLGNITVTDANDYILRSNSNYVKTWEEIKNKLIDNLGGYILVRRVDGVNYIDYLLDSPYMSTQQIELGENLLDVIKETRADDIITALIPLGAKLKDEEGNETETRLTIESVNGGLDYIYDADAVAQYGYIFDTVTYDNVTVASNLLTKAQQDLAIKVNLGVNVELKAIDLSMVDVNLDEIRVFEYVQVTSNPHDIDTMALITKQSIDLLNPQNNTLTFGFSYQSFTDKQIQSDKVIKEIKADYVTNQQVTNAINTIELTPGPPTYTWIRYADDVNGSGISNDPTGKTYIGFAYNKLTATESNIASDYTWSLIQGPKGDTGVKGDTGADGQTLYTWIKYSDNADGTGLYDVPKASTLYIGIATNKTTATESTVKTDYVWSKFKGDTGYTPIKGVDYFDGVDGQDGKGIVSSIVRYQNHTNGTTPPTGTWTENPSPIKGQYLWTRTVTTYTEGSPVPTYSVAYQAIDGTDGTDGRGIVSTVVDYVKSTTATMPSSGWSTNRPTVNKGEYLWTRTTINYTSGSPSVSISNSYVPTDGQNGSSAYLWVRYSQNANGNPMDTSPADAKYIGVATTSTSTAPTEYTLYSWSLIKGTDGIAGEDGNDGQTSYLHIKYSNDGGTTFTSNNGETVGDWIGTYVDFIEADSNNVNDYTWNKVKGDTGPQGATGERGPKGDTGTSVSSVVEWYLATNLASGVTTSTSGWNTTMQPMSTTKKYLWNYEVINFSDGSSSPTIPVIIGVYGNTGATGRALTGVTEYYLASASASGVTRPSTDGTNGWTTAMQTTSVDKPYLWNYEKLTWSVTPTTSYIEPIIIGVHGATGPQGDEGPQGVQGPKGDNGISQYVHIRYSANSNGNPMTPSPQATTKYIGLANTTSSTAPTGYASYTWSLIKGTDGVDGVDGMPGEPGEDGNPNYTWVKYADNELGENMSDYPSGKMYIGLAFNKLTNTESSDPLDYQWSAMYDLEALADVEHRVTSAIIQTADEIRTEVADTYISTGALDSYKSEVSTQFTQTSTDYTYLFSQLDTYVQTLDGDTQAQFSEISKYIRFTDGNIELGDSTSQIKLVLENDIIKFVQNGVSVAYIDNNTLYITDGRFLTSLRIGNFAFTPRANGNLSFGKVV